MLKDKNKAIIIVLMLAAIIFLAFLSRNLIYNQFLEMQHADKYTHDSLKTANIISTIFILIFSAVFSLLGFRKAKEKGSNAQQWAVICLFFNLWGYLFLLMKKRTSWLWWKRKESNEQFMTTPSRGSEKHAPYAAFTCTIGTSQIFCLVLFSRCRWKC